LAPKSSKNLADNKKQLIIKTRYVTIDELVKSRKVPFFVIPAPHQVRDKLQPGT